MRLARPALAVAVAAALLTGLSSADAASAPKPPPPVVITDNGGDANAINSQGGLAPIPSVGSPVQIAGADILSIAFSTMTTAKKVKGKSVLVPTGLKVVMTLAAPPQANVLFRATPQVGECKNFDLSYSKLLDGGVSSGLRHSCPGFKPKLPTDGYQDVEVDSAVAQGSTITWILLAGKSLPTAVTPGVAVSGLSGHSRFYAGTSVTGGATIPVLDEISGDKTFRYGK